jgi:integrase
MTYRHNDGIFDGMSKYRQKYRQKGGNMALNATFIKNSTKHTGAPAGDKHTDGGGMYLLVNAGGRYWRMDYRFAEKRKTLALGVYPAVSLEKARQRRVKARELLAAGIDPNAAKQEAKQTTAATAANTFEIVAREWLAKTAADRMASTDNKITKWLNHDVFPYIGKMPIANIGPRDVLGALRHMETRGALDSVQRVKQVCGQVFRYAVASGSAERDVTQDLKGALAKATPGNFAAITDPKQAGQLMRSIFDYSGHPCTVAALKLSPLVFVRPGELRTAEWAEIDLDAAEWRIPGSKMKMKADHIVPLCTQSVGILRSIQPITGHGQFVFPSMRTGERPMSENTVNSALRGMGYAKETHSAHGFRAMARTILDEVLDQRVDLIEHQLAHAVKDANGRAYNRTAHLPARRKMMQAWGDYLDKLRTGADVIQLRTTAT